MSSQSSCVAGLKKKEDQTTITYYNRIFCTIDFVMPVTSHIEGLGIGLIGISPCHKLNSTILSFCDSWVCACCRLGFMASIGRVLFHIFRAILGPPLVLSLSPF